MKKGLLIGFILMSLLGSTIDAGNGSSTIIHNGEIFAVKWSPDSTMLAVQGVGGTWVYDRTGEEITYLEEDYVDMLLRGIADRYTKFMGSRRRMGTRKQPACHATFHTHRQFEPHEFEYLAFTGF